MKRDTQKAWAALWRSEDKMDGRVEHFIRSDLHVQLFRTRAACRDWIAERFGYIRDRPDLRREPHGWRVPVAVKVCVTVERR